MADKPPTDEFDPFALFGAPGDKGKSRDDGAELIPTFEDANTSYLQFMEAKGATNMDMLSQQGLEFQAEYLKQLGDQQHPMDVARRLSLNPFASPRDRLAACKLVMEYTMRKIPAQMELSGKDGAPLAIGADALKKLSNTELDTLMALLAKANGQ